VRHSRSESSLPLPSDMLNSGGGGSGSTSVTWSNMADERWDEPRDRGWLCSSDQRDDDAVCLRAVPRQLHPATCFRPRRRHGPFAPLRSRSALAARPSAETAATSVRLQSGGTPRGANLQLGESEVSGRWSAVRSCYPQQPRQLRLRYVSSIIYLFIIWF